MKKINRIFSKLKYVYFSISAFFIVNLYNTTNSFAIGGTGGKFIDSFNDLSNFATLLTNGMLGFSMLSGIAVVLYHIVQLALAGNNPNERSKILKNLFTCAICLALLGSVGLVMSFVMFYAGI